MLSQETLLGLIGRIYDAAAWAGVLGGVCQRGERHSNHDRFSRLGLPQSEVDPIVWTKFRPFLDRAAGVTKTAAVRPPSIPGLNRRSGRIPALPCPPIKPLDCTAAAVCSKAKTSILVNESDKSQGVWGTESPIMAMTFSFWFCAGTGRPVFDSRAPGADAGDCKSGNSFPEPGRDRDRWRSRRGRSTRI